jgi:hypothetical protein
LRARLQVERGALVRRDEPATRKAALGQSPVDMRAPREESTRAHLDSPTPSPTLGIASSSSPPHPTLVRVLSELSL